MGFLLAFNQSTSDILFFSAYIKKLDFGKLKLALKFSSPLILVVTFSWIIDISDKYMINFFLGKVDVGLYSLAYGLAIVVITIPSIFQSIIQPYFAEKWNLEENSSFYFNLMLKYSLITTLPMITILYILRSQLITLISGEQYLLATQIFGVLLLFPLLVIIIEILNKTMYLCNKIKQITFIYFISAIINLILNVIFIKKFGTIGAAYSTVFSYFILLLFLLYFKPVKFTFQMKYLKIIRLFIATILMGSVLYTINPQIYWAKLVIILLGILIYIILLFLFGVFSKEEKKMLTYIFAKLRKFKIKIRQI